MKLRDYQVRAVAAAYRALVAGRRRVCIVAPPGAGKTAIGRDVVRTALSSGKRVLWLAHRIELVDQAASRLTGLGAAVGVIAAGRPADPSAAIQVSSIQTLHARRLRPRADVVIPDEVHHYRARTYQPVLDHYATSAHVGLTATPERSDGKPLLGLFDHLVVAATYGELINGGYLVPCRVLRPNEALGSDLGKDPVLAYQQHGDEAQAFVFAGSIRDADKYAAAFSQASIPSASITERTPATERETRIEAFRRGELRVLTNCYTLTEGLDVPQASVCILARGTSHVTPYLQMTGRVLRPAHGKTSALLIDLPGVSYKHGLPTENRKYSLGNGIAREPGLTPLRVCVWCGWPQPGGGKCQHCGKEPPVKRRRPPRIYNKDLREVFDFERTPEPAKQAELDRLIASAESNGFSMYWAVKQYKELFGAKPDMSIVPPRLMREEYRRLAKIAAERGFQRGWAFHRYRETFGQPPDFQWQS